jgi:DNA-binding NtrC family response regulator
MVLRLVARVGGKEVRLPVCEGANLVGSDIDCNLRLIDPTVSRRHASLSVVAGLAEVADLGSSNGTLLEGRRFTGAVSIAPGVSVTFGTVVATLEEVAAGDLETGVLLAVSRPEVAPTPAPGATESLGSVVAFTLEGLPAIVDCLAHGDGPLSTARAAAAALFQHVPCLEVTVDDARAGKDGVLFTARRPEIDGQGATIEVTAGLLRIRVVLATANVPTAHRRVVEIAANLVRAAHEVPGPAPPATSAAPPPLPEPPTVEPAMLRLYDDARRVARGEVCVLVTGESGTGKEVVARYIHAASPRQGGPFVALNCAALPRDLLEAELFGIERGVATGVESRAGRFEVADGGTLFLDEIGDMPPEVQATILRVLQEGCVYRLGGREPRRAAVRVISATNRDIDGLLTRGAFRLDLFHRIADWRVHMPSLRERVSDIPNLAAFFLAREGARLGTRPGGLSRTAMDILMAHEWPGNIRQLEREMARAALFIEDGELLETRHLSVTSVVPTGDRTLQETLADFERREIRRALAVADGDTAAAAALLGIARSSLYRRIKDLGLDLPSGGES